MVNCGANFLVFSQSLLFVSAALDTKGAYLGPAIDWRFVVKVQNNQINRRSFGNSVCRWPGDIHISRYS